jgi:cold-inducible RNA-binding protein
MSYDTTSRELETLFAEVGEVVEIFLPTDRSTGRPRGFAFVEFTEASSVATAIEKLDGHELQGRNLRVSEAAERQRRPPGFSDGGGGGGGGGYGAGPPRGPKGGGGGKPKGSRRNIRGKKRGF